MKTIYIDVLIGLNFFINYFLLLAVKRLCKAESCRFRFILSSSFASLMSLLIFMPQINIFLSFFIKLLITSLVIIIAFKVSNFKRMFLYSSVYFGVSFLYAGSMFFIWLSTKSDNMIINNSVVYINISPVVFILSVIGTYLVILLLKRILSVKMNDSQEFELTLCFNKNKSKVLALYDSGNMLQDAFCDFPVIVISESVCLNLSGFNLAALKNPQLVNNLQIRVIPCRTVTNSGILFGYIIDSAEIFIEGKNYISSPVIVAVSNAPLSNGIDALVGESFYNSIKEKDYEFEKITDKT